MAAELNHTIVWSSDPAKSAAFLADVLGRPKPTRFYHFHVVKLDNGVSMDFCEGDGKISMQHYAFLIGEDDFDQVFARVRARDLLYWADPARSKPNEINHWGNGRGFYFEDPDGHFLEVLTHPYEE